MNLHLERRWKKAAYTIGRLSLDGAYFCDTLEDTDRGLRQEMDYAELYRRKRYAETAIPAGRYRLTLDVQSPKYAHRKQYAFCQGHLPRLLDVPAYAGVLIHIGNTPRDTAGCILVGRNTVVGEVRESTATFRRLYARLADAHQRQEDLWITID